MQDTSYLTYCTIVITKHAYCFNQVHDASIVPCTVQWIHTVVPYTECTLLVTGAVDHVEEHVSYLHHGHLLILIFKQATLNP